jgi:uridine kinase
MIIGVCGITGAGKSALVDRLAETLSGIAVHWDDFDPISEAPEDYVEWVRTSKNYNDWKYDGLAEVLKNLKAGNAVKCPATHRLLQPAQHILFDAPLGYLHKATGQYIDFLVGLDTPLDIALARRIIRDLKRGLSTQQLISELTLYLEQARPLFIMPPEMKQGCHLLLDGSLSVAELEHLVLSALNQRAI